MNRLAIFALLGSVSALALTAGSARAAALPSGGHYVSGKGEIGKAGQSLTVKQSSTTGVIDWNKFSIGSKNAVSFDNGSGATLNRVTGGNLSTIAGSLHATGSLYLMNSSGVIVSGTGRVVTGGGFVATTGNISNTAFGDNDTRFKPGSGRIVNRGSITAGGTATLSGRDVADSGTIRASRVNLQAQNKLVIGGEITARNADGSGGTIVATGRHIDVGHNASLSASGTRGGTVLIGGDVHGGAIASDNFVQQNVRDAATTVIAKGAQISADASKSTGGNIVIWSDGHTSFNGKISAEGQTSGGFAEVSSHDLLGFTGTANLTSTAGKTGELLLDPENVMISAAANSKNSCSAGTCTPTGGTSVLNVTTLENALATADVVVNTGSSGSQTGNITVVAPITWSANTLTLDAFHSINIEATISATGTAGLTFTTNDGGTGGDYNFNGGNITFANTSQAFTINGTSYTLLDSMSDVQGINANLSGHYALANSLDASSTNNWVPIGVDGSGNVLNFTGTFTGLGNTISNLTFNIDNAGGYAGLFGYSSGTIRNIGVVGGSINGRGEDSDAFVGGLVGQNTGTITDSFATGDVEGNADTLAFVGGLVGANSGSITRSFATGTVGIADSGVVSAGGLVGTSSGTISDSFAMGAVTRSTSDAKAPTGGLVGTVTGGSISNSYSVGAVTENNKKGTPIGGFIGELDGGTISNGYWDKDSSGSLLGFRGIGVDHNNQSGNVTGTTTTALQGSLPSGFSSTFWGTGPGLFPYLLWQFPSGTPQAISGTILDEPPPHGVPLSGAQVFLLIDGQSVTPGLSVESTETGYYYLLLAPGTLNGSQAIVYFSSTFGSWGHLSGAAFIENASGTTTAPINSGYLNEITPDNQYSQIAPDLATAVGSNSTVQNIIDGLGVEVTSTAANFNIDQAIDEKNFAISSTGTVTQSAPITATNLDLLGSGGTFALTNAGNSIGTLESYTTGSIDLVDDGDLKINSVTATTVDLVSSGTIEEDGQGSGIFAETLTGSSHGAVKLNGPDSFNNVADMGNFSTHGHSFSLKNEDFGLAVTGTVDVGSATLSLTTSGDVFVNDKPVGPADITLDGKLRAGSVDLTSFGRIMESAAGGIDADTITGSSNGLVRLNSGHNVIADLGDFSTDGSHPFTLVDDDDLTTKGTVDTIGTLSLTTTGNGHDLIIDSVISGGTVNLVSAGKATERKSAAIEAKLLNVTADTGIMLTSSKNHIQMLGTDKTNSGPNKVTL